MKNLYRISAAALALALAMATATAQESQPAVESAEEAPIQSVRVHGVRDPAMMSYEKAHELLTKVEQAGKGKMTMLVRLLSKQSMRPMPDLEVALRGENNDERLTVTPEGFLTVPLSQERVADKAFFVTNKKKGSVKAEFFFVPRLPAGQIRFGDMADSLAAARQARVHVVPWYVRPFFRPSDEVRLCYPDKGQHVTVTGTEAPTRPASTQIDSYLTKTTVYCAAFTGAETAAARDIVVTPAPGWIALFN